MLTGLPFTDPNGNPCVVNNRIAPGCISPVAQNLLKFVPSSPTGTVVSLAASPIQENLGLLRVDWNASEKNRLSGHYYENRSGRTSPTTGNGNLAGFIGETFDVKTQQLTLNDIHTFRPNLINQAIFSFLDSSSNELQNKTIDPTTLGINMPQYVPTGAVDVNVGNNFDLGSGYTTEFSGKNYQFKDSLNWIKGRHNFKFGYELLHLGFRQIFIGSPNFDFSGVRSGDPAADFMLGAFDTLSLDFGVRDNDVYTDFNSFYFQDEYKLSPRLTMTYGVRYEPFLPWKDRKDRIDTVVPGAQSKVVPDAPPGILFPGDLPRGLASADLNNFAPRIGFAWDVFGDGRTSIRTGYGVFYESVNADSLAQENPPFAGFGNAFRGRIENPFGSTGLANPPATTSGQFGCVKIATYPGYSCPLFPLPVGGVFTNPGLRSPYIQSFDFDIQRQITPQLHGRGGLRWQNRYKD